MCQVGPRIGGYELGRALSKILSDLTPMAVAPVVYPYGSRTSTGGEYLVSPQSTQGIGSARESVMVFSRSARRLAASITGILLVTLSGAAFAANPPTASAPTKEMREKMAVLHEQMAACLRSDKSLSECRAEMQKSCHEMMGNQGCAMMMGRRGKMGMGQGMHGPMHGPMMSNPPAGSSPPK